MTGRRCPDLGEGGALTPHFGFTRFRTRFNGRLRGIPAPVRDSRLSPGTHLFTQFRPVWAGFRAREHPSAEGEGVHPPTLDMGTVLCTT